MFSDLKTRRIMYSIIDIVEKNFRFWGFRSVDCADRKHVTFENDKDRFFCEIINKNTLQLSAQLYSCCNEHKVWGEELFKEVCLFINEFNSKNALLKLSEQAGVVMADYIIFAPPNETLDSQVHQWVATFRIILMRNLKAKILERPMLRDALGQQAYWGICHPLERIRRNGYWTDIRQYSEGLVAVADHKGCYGYLDSETEQAIRCRWAFAQPFSEGLAAVEDHTGHYGFIDRTGRVVIPCEWEGATWFSEGLAAVMDANGEWGFINKYGRLIVPCTWAETDDFSQGQALVWDADDIPYIIDIQGNIIAYGQKAADLAATANR